MKKRFLTFALFLGAIGFIFNGCQKTAEEIKNQTPTQKTTSTTTNQTNSTSQKIQLTFTTESGSTVDFSIDRYPVPPTGPVEGDHLPKVGVFIHGIAHNGSVFFKPLMEELKTTGKYDGFIVINLPGHAGKGWTPGKRYGDLSLRDYVTAVETALDFLTNPRKAPEPVKISFICGHSLGGNLLIQIQDRWSTIHSGLKKKYGVDKVVLLSPSIPAPLAWFAADIPVAFPTSPKAVINSVTVRTDAVKGPYLNPTPELFIGFFYATRAGMPVPSPSIPEILANMETEPYTAVAQLIGLSADGKSDVPRISVKPGIFDEVVDKKPLELIIVTCSEDPLTNKTEQDALANYLKPGSSSIEVGDPFAVHGMPFTQPKEFVKFF